MPARDFHVNLTNRAFPHNFDELGSTIIQATPFEQNRQISGGFSGEGAEESLGICQAYFMQNVLPTTRGYSSVSFLETLPPIPGQSGVLEDFHLLRGVANATAIFAPTTDKQYIFDPTVGSWEEFSIETLAPEQPSVAYVKQRSFIFYPTIGCFEYDFEARELVPIELVGLNSGNILGVCSAGSVLVAWDATTVYWSSVLDPTDFVPSLSTGAGSTSILAVRGEIITCYPLGQNFVIYTATNAVGARATGNVQSPFTFSEIAGSEGISSQLHVAYDSNQGVHITWTASGFQQVSLDQAGYIWPEFSDGIIRAIYSDYDENFNRPVLRAVERLELKLSFVSNRWVAISVKDAADVTGSYTFAMVYDTSLQRWGRLDVLHKDFVEFVRPDISRSMTYAELAAEYPLYEDMLGVPYQTFAKNKVISSPQSGLNFGVALSNGSIFRAALYQTGLQAETVSGIIAAEPRIILGKFKIFRTSGAMLHGFKAQRLEVGVAIRAHLHSYTGELVGSKVGFVENPKHAGHFLGRANADSFSLEFSGKFHLTDLVCSAADAGKRNQRSISLVESQLCVMRDEECVKAEIDGTNYCVIVGGTEGNFDPYPPPPPPPECILPLDAPFFGFPLPTFGENQQNFSQQSEPGYYATSTSAKFGSIVGALIGLEFTLDLFEPQIGTLPLDLEIAFGEGDPEVVEDPSYLTLVITITKDEITDTWELSPSVFGYFNIPIEFYLDAIPIQNEFPYVRGTYKFYLGVKDGFVHVYFGQDLIGQFSLDGVVFPEGEYYAVAAMYQDFWGEPDPETEEQSTVAARFITSDNSGIYADWETLCDMPEPPEPPPIPPFGEVEYVFVGQVDGTDSIPLTEISGTAAHIDEKGWITGRVPGTPNMEVWKIDESGVSFEYTTTAGGSTNLRPSLTSVSASRETVCFWVQGTSYRCLLAGNIINNGNNPYSSILEVGGNIYLHGRPGLGTRTLVFGIADVINGTSTLLRTLTGSEYNVFTVGVAADDTHVYCLSNTGMFRFMFDPDSPIETIPLEEIDAPTSNERTWSNYKALISPVDGYLYAIFADGAISDSGMYRHQLLRVDKTTGTIVGQTQIRTPWPMDYPRCAYFIDSRNQLHVTRGHTTDYMKLKISLGPTEE